MIINYLFRIKEGKVNEEERTKKRNSTLIMPFIQNLSINTSA
jgi:hypothetical protein